MKTPSEAEEVIGLPTGGSGVPTFRIVAHEVDCGGDESLTPENLPRYLGMVDPEILSPVGCHVEYFVVT